MLTLKDFLHLPQLDAVVADLVDDEPGLVMAVNDPSPGGSASGRQRAGLPDPHSLCEKRIRK